MSLKNHLILKSMKQSSSGDVTRHLAGTWNTLSVAGKAFGVEKVLGDGVTHPSAYFPKAFS